ncbi:MAG: type I restriction enzyme HsdR N-terminal domain-containing protein [Flavobacteriaceae bacterium]|nr:type I restriction enzyme HsdR N-terminal domain-containing protein [Flavobacteriaceae bacterium]
MQALNYPAYQFKVKNSENKQYIFDVIRKKYVVLTPEEWVRQHVLHYLIKDLNYPKSIIAVEKQLVLNGLRKRFDILIFNKSGLPEIIIECKSFEIKINQDAFDQIARYNLKLNAKFLMVSNGLVHYFCSLDHKNECYNFLKNIPNYSKP